MIKNIAVLGLGKVGSLVGTLLSKSFDVTGMDKGEPYEPLPFKVKTGDVGNEKTLQTFLKDKDAVVSCLPYHLNIVVSSIAAEMGVHYFDLTEDVPTLHHILKLAKKTKSILAPQCGLAPGFIGIVGSSLYNQFDSCRAVKMRVGALPFQPMGKLGYSITWSADGVINEYINDAEVIHNGVRKTVPSMDDLEVININGRAYEAFYTSGGLGTMCETLDGKIDTLNYKTIRYPGHAEYMKFLMYDLGLKHDRELLKKIMTEALPIVDDDIVLVYAAAEGVKNGRLLRKEFNESYRTVDIDGKKWRAISWTTACSIAAVVEMAAAGKFGKKGFVKQEDISLEDFLQTQNGSMYASFADKK